MLALNPLLIDGSKPGADGMARVTLGRFLFRDGSQPRPQPASHLPRRRQFGSRTPASSRATAGGIQVNDFIDRVNPSFDGADAMAFDYETRIDTIEIKLHRQVAHGPRPDGPPAGRRLGPLRSHFARLIRFLAGLRYLNLSDELNITADRDADVATSEGGFYNVDAENHLFGGQLGGTVAHETARWSVAFIGKAGSYWNRMHLDSDFTAGTATAATTGAVGRD